MAKSKRPPEQKSNTFEPEDMIQIIGEVEDLEAEIKSTMARAMGEVGGIRKKIKNIKKRAKDDLAIPSSILSAVLKTRKLERQIKKVADDVPEDMAEVWADASGQYSFFAPEGEEPAEPGETAAQRAAKQRKVEAEANQASELEEGGRVLDELTGTAH